MDRAAVEQLVEQITSEVVAVLRMEENKAVLKVESGKYEFRSVLK